MPSYFAGVNVFESSLTGDLLSTCSTTATVHHPEWTNEPTGVAINPSNNHIFFSDDSKGGRVHEVSLGADGIYCTSDDTVTTVSSPGADAEGVAYHANTLWIAVGIDGGNGNEVYWFDLGPNGRLGGGDDGPVHSFDTAALGFNDLEGIEYNPDRNTLFIVSAAPADRYLGEVSLTGSLLRKYDLSYLGSQPRSGLAYGPSSQNPSLKSIYIAGRGVDNDVNPLENDGKIWEIRLLPGVADTTGVFRPSNGALYLKNKNTTGFADVAINYGLGGDYPVTGDWDGDGDDTIGVYRGGLFYLRNANTIGFADLVFAFGSPGDQPVAGDWDGDGDDTIGVYRSGTFFLRNSNSTGAPDRIFSLGVPGDVGIAGDWDGDGDDTTGVFRPSNGALFLKNTSSTGFADIQINYGLPGDMPVTGDWDGDGDDTIGIYRNGAFYLRNSNTIGFADIVFALGIPGDMPIAGDWDGLP